MYFHTNCHCLQAVVYNWACSPSCNIALIPEVDIHKPDLFIPGPIANNPFVPGTQYTFTITTSFGNSSVKSTDKVTVVFDPAPIQAVLKGPSGYVNVASASIEVDACSSKAPDNATAALVYTFACTLPDNTPCPPPISSRFACLALVLLGMHISHAQTCLLASSSSTHA